MFPHYNGRRSAAAVSRYRCTDWDRYISMVRVLPALPVLGQGYRTGVSLCQPVSTSVLLVTYRAPPDAT